MLKPIRHRAVAGAAANNRLENGRLMLASVRQPSRAGWGEASRAIAEKGDTTLVWPAFGNAGDDDLTW
jgi:hypothetical protein